MPHTLLLADDSVTIQRVIELTFADEDVRVVAVGDGDQAIEALNRTPPDIVLADVGMPGRNGYEVAQYIKDTPHLAHIPVLLLTGAFEPIDQPRATAVGCDGVLAKPFEPQLVIARVKELLARPKIPVALDSPLAPPSAPAEPWAGVSGGTGIFDEPTVVRGPVKTETAEVDRYFDRLDQAFATLSNPGQEAPAPPARSLADEIDWFATVPEAPPPPPAAPVAPVAPVDDWPLAPPASEPEPPFVHAMAPPTPVPAPLAPPAPPPPQQSTLPPLADAFAALLAAEQSAPAAWPPPPANNSDRDDRDDRAAVWDEVIEEIVTRVLARLSDRVVRETVADIASAAAERLVREEIDRIKRSIE